MVCRKSDWLIVLGDIRWVLDRVLERFDAFECLTRLSLENIKIEEEKS